MLEETGYPQFKDYSLTVEFTEVILEKIASTSTFQLCVNMIYKEIGLK